VVVREVQRNWRRRNAVGGIDGWQLTIRIGGERICMWCHDALGGEKPLVPAGLTGGGGGG
jgi:hypothetical protein